MTINDAKKSNLTVLGYGGAIDDAYLAFLKTITGATGTVNDLERIVFTNAGFKGNLNDMWLQHFANQGITTGSFNDRMLVAWKTLSGAGLVSAAYANLLLETGFDILQEDGFLILL